MIFFSNFHVFLFKFDGFLSFFLLSGFGASREETTREGDYRFFVYDKSWAIPTQSAPVHKITQLATQAIDEFPQLKDVNSQQAEQINQSLRSLATDLAHYKWESMSCSLSM